MFCLAGFGLTHLLLPDTGAHTQADTIAVAFLGSYARLPGHFMFGSNAANSPDCDSSGNI